MKKSGCLLFLAVFLIATALVYSISFTVRKTSAPKKEIAQVTENEEPYENNQADSNSYENNDNSLGNSQSAARPEEPSYFKPYQVLPPIKNESKNCTSCNPYSSAQKNHANSQKPQTKTLSRKTLNSSMPQNARQINRPDYRYEDNSLSAKIKSCKPYRETLNAPYNGVDMNYKIDIEGWHNGKCILNFEASANGVNSEFMADYGIEISNTSVVAFTPNIRCEFTRAQLLYVGDSLLEEKARDNGKTYMLKDPNSITFPEPDKIQLSDLKLLDLLIRQRACKISNWDEFKSIIQQVNDFFQF